MPIEDYIKKLYSSNMTTLVITLGVHSGFFGFKHHAILKKQANVLALKDPFNLIFYKGLDGTSDLTAMTQYIQSEITTLNPTKVVIVAMCINCLPALKIGLSLDVDKIYLISPFTYVPLDDFPDLIKSHTDNNGTQNKIKGLEMWQKATDTDGTDVNFRPFTESLEMNLQLSADIGDTDIFYYYGDCCPQDLYYFNLLTEASKAKLSSQSLSSRRVGDTLKLSNLIDEILS